MENFEVSKKIEACEVDLNLLREIEGYIDKSTGDGHVSTLVSGSAGEQLFDSLEGFAEADLPDKISTIEFEAQYQGVSDEARLSFSEDSGKNQLSIRLTGNNAKPRVLELVREIDEMLDGKKAITRFVHSGFVYPLFVFAAVIPAGLLARNIVSAFSPLDAFFTVFASSVYTLVMVFIIRQIIPYCLFDSQRNKKVKRIGGYVVKSFAAIVVFAVLTAWWIIYI
mgnify:CR=1 FL=1|jgi:hypothetical protein